MSRAHRWTFGPHLWYWTNGIGYWSPHRWGVSLLRLRAGRLDSERSAMTRLLSCWVLSLGPVQVQVVTTGREGGPYEDIPPAQEWRLW